MGLFKITSAINRETGATDTFKIGRIVYEPEAMPSGRLWAQYADSEEFDEHVLYTSRIETVNDFNGGFDVTTQDEIYRFEGINNVYKKV